MCREVSEEGCAVMSGTGPASCLGETGGQEIRTDGVRCQHRRMQGGWGAPGRGI